MSALHNPLAAVIAANAIGTVGGITTGSLVVGLTGDDYSRTIPCATRAC